MVSKIRTGLKPYLTFAKNSILLMYTYKMALFIEFIGVFIRVAVLYYLWDSLYKNSPDAVINGFTFENMIVYVVMMQVITMVLFVFPDLEMSREIREGSITQYLIKPIKYKYTKIAIVIGENIGFFTILFIPILIIICAIQINLGINLMPTAFNLIFFLVSLILAFIVDFHYAYIFGLLSFYTLNSWGLFTLRRAITMLLSGAIIPLAFFPNQIQKVIEYLPFAQVRHAPIMIYLGKYESTNELIKLIGLQLIWAVIFIIIAEVLWKAAVRKLQVLGG